MTEILQFFTLALQITGCVFGIFTLLAIMLLIVQENLDYYKRKKDK